LGHSQSKPIFRWIIPWLFAGSPEVVELLDALFQIAVDALLVDAEEGELFRIGQETRALLSAVWISRFSVGSSGLGGRRRNADLIPG
jgi:hypothetical protein